MAIIGAAVPAIHGLVSDMLGSMQLSFFIVNFSVLWLCRRIFL